MKEEDAKRQKIHATKIAELSEWLCAEVWEKYSCGNDGTLEAQKVKELAKDAIKIIVEYL